MGKAAFCKAICLETARKLRRLRAAFLYQASALLSAARPFPGILPGINCVDVQAMEDAIVGGAFSIVSIKR